MPAVPDGEEPVVRGAGGESGKREDEGEAKQGHGERINHGWTRMNTDESVIRESWDKADDLRDPHPNYESETENANEPRNKSGHRSWAKIDPDE
jgi:hypothetical protein